MRKLILIAVLAITASLFVSLHDARACAVGDSAQVRWKGSWYPAKVLRVDGNKCFIHYDGYGSNWDEWVGPDRIKVAGGASTSASASSDSAGVGDSVQVLWKGSWYPAHVIGVKGKQLRIHYDGYDSSWDEWVGPNRYRK